MATPTSIILGPGATFDCGCHVAMRGDDVRILYCPTHRAAERMRGLLRAYVDADLLRLPEKDRMRTDAEARALLRELRDGG